MTTDHLAVPGASLYHETTGSGPVLLMIPGGAADADTFAGIAPLLADRYTVVRHDPRGISRSAFESEPVDVPVEVHADDAGRLLAAVAEGEAAFVLGSSGGAQIGLALAHRHPERVRTLVAHEPPVWGLLPENDGRRNGIDRVYETYRTQGPGPAMGVFLSLIGIEGGMARREATPEVRARMARQEQNLDFFFAHYMLPISNFVPDLDALRTGTPRVVVGVGEDSSGQLANDTARALASRLDIEPVTFPGGHGGFMTHPARFAEILHEVLRHA